MNDHIEYHTQRTIDNYRCSQHKSKVHLLTKRFNQSESDRRIAAICEAEDQEEAFKVYQEMRAIRVCGSDRDALLYHH